MTSLVMAGTPIQNAADHLRRYCGLPWSGGAPEVWAYSYYDALADPDPHDLFPVDVLAAAGLHAKLTHRDLAWFANNRDRLRGFLSETPNVDLGEADPSLLDALPAIASDEVELSLLTKVLHRKRPRLVPLLDRRLLDWYRLRLSVRGAAAWPELTRVMAADLSQNRDSLESLRAVVPLTHLRIADIAIWMERVNNT